MLWPDESHQPEEPAHPVTGQRAARSRPVPEAAGPYSPSRAVPLARFRHRRTGEVSPRRVVLLVVGLTLISTAVGMAVGLSTTTNVIVPPQPGVTPDQQLADRIMLTRGDLPSGWTESKGPGPSSASKQLQKGEAAVTHTFARCVGVSDQQAAAVLGGQSSDQTAQAVSPIFVAPSTPAAPGFALELQTAASVVRTRNDAQRDLGVFERPGYPTCAANAVAAELQLGVDNTSGDGGQAGAATGSVTSVPAPAGEEASVLRASFTVTDRSVTVPIEVESVALGDDRIEGDLQAFAVDGSVPAPVLDASIAAFEQRVAGRAGALPV